MSRRMSRTISVLFAVAALAVSSFAYAADPASGRDRAQQEKAQQADAVECAETTQQDMAPVVTLEQMFTASAESESIETDDGVSAAVGPIEVVVSRIGADGKPIMACVDTLKAARHFFDTPIEQLPKAKEQ